MKLFQILLIALNISWALTCDEKSKSKEDCLNSLENNPDKEFGATRCCYVRFKKENLKEQKLCVPINEYQFKRITKYMEYAYMAAGTEDLNIECYSSYFKFGLISIILLLF